MKVLFETTDWEWPNHVYFVNDAKDKCYAYSKRGTGVVEEFKVPYRFGTSKRKFKEVTNTWGYVEPELVKPTGKSWIVAGSKGNSYTVTEEAGELSCTCTGFKYYGKCKHVESIKV